jgi:hypothetical protein
MARATAISLARLWDMMNFDWPDQEDLKAERGRDLPSSFSAQGIRDALRNAYCEPCDAIPKDFATLLEKLG